MAPKIEFEEELPVAAARGRGRPPKKAVVAPSGVVTKRGCGRPPKEVAESSAAGAVCRSAVAAMEEPPAAKLLR